MEWIMNNWLWLVIPGYLALNFRIVWANEYGVYMVLGMPKFVCGPGPILTLWPFTTLERCTAELMKIHYFCETINSKRGVVDGYPGIIDSSKINIEGTITCRFDKDKLKEVVKLTSGRDAVSLTPDIRPAIKDVVKEAGSGPWRLANDFRAEFAQYVECRLIRKGRCMNIMVEEVEVEEEGKKGKKANRYFFGWGGYDDVTWENLKDSPIVLLGLKEVTVMVENVDFADEKMKEAVSKPETARLEAQALIRKTDGDEDRTVRMGTAEAKARNEMIKVIKKAPELEVLDTWKEMSKGASTKFVLGAPGSHDSIKNSLVTGLGFGEGFKEGQDQKENKENKAEKQEKLNAGGGENG